MTAAAKKKPAKPDEILREAAELLKKRFHGMSLRAVAARLGISPSYWSKILRGEKPLAQNLLPNVVKVLGMDSQQVARLQRAILETIENERLAPVTGLRTSRESVDSPVENYKNLSREDFWILGEWFYVPILNLYSLENAQPTEAAERLGLGSSQAADAVKKLIKNGFLIEKDGKIERTDRQVRFPTDRSYEEVRKYHESMLLRAKQELTREDTRNHFDARLISAVCFSGSSQKLKEARLILEEAMYRAANLMADEPGSDEVYQLNLQLFPLTKSPTGK